MAGFVPAIHELPPVISYNIKKHCVRSTYYDDGTTFSWMAGSKPGHDAKDQTARVPENAANSYRYKTPFSCLLIL
jgi:hypothetical protein